MISFWKPWPGSWYRVAGPPDELKLGNVVVTKANGIKKKVFVHSVRGPFKNNKTGEQFMVGEFLEIEPKEEPMQKGELVLDDILRMILKGKIDSELLAKNHGYYDRRENTKQQFPRYQSYISHYSFFIKRESSGKIKDGIYEQHPVYVVTKMPKLWNVMVVGSKEYVKRSFVKRFFHLGLDVKWVFDGHSSPEIPAGCEGVIVIRDLTQDSSHSSLRDECKKEGVKYLVITSKLSQHKPSIAREFPLRGESIVSAEQKETPKEASPVEKQSTVQTPSPAKNDKEISSAEYEEMIEKESNLRKRVDDAVANLKKQEENYKKTNEELKTAEHELQQIKMMYEDAFSHHQSAYVSLDHARIEAKNAFEAWKNERP